MIEQQAEQDPAVDDVFGVYSERELLLYCARMLSRLEPLVEMFESPPPMIAGLLAARRRR